MAYHSFYAIERGVPAFRKAIWRSFYSLLAKRITLKQWTFMNYGYSHLESGHNILELAEVDEADRPVEKSSLVFSNRHKGESFIFMQGDAENLQESDSSAGAVVNVESCHHYPDPGVFLNEVFRVLKPISYRLS